MSKNAPDKLMHDLGYAVRNYKPGPELVVARCPWARGHVNLIIGGHVMEVSLRELVNALHCAVKDASENGVRIITPEIAVP